MKNKSQNTTLLTKNKQESSKPALSNQVSRTKEQRCKDKPSTTNRKLVIISKSEVSRALLGFLFHDKDIVTATDLNSLSGNITDTNTYIVIYENFLEDGYPEMLRNLEKRFQNAVKVVFRADHENCTLSDNFFTYTEPLTQEDILKEIVSSN